MGEPTAIGGILHGTAQCCHTVLGIGQATGDALQVGQGKAMGHAGGVDGFGTGTGGELPIGIQVTETVG
ncbi:hypothetical protein D3C75_1296830 [compost metagenome]